jgi:hypothetical protein
MTSATPVLEALIARFADDYSSDTFGFPQLSDLTDLRQRAVVSDQILVTADAIATNLDEAGMHASEYLRVLGPHGRQMGRASDPADVAAREALERDLVGFFRAMGSVADCLAAVSIGVLRLPRQIQRADASDLARIRVLGAEASGDAAALWTGAGDAFELACATPVGWFEWTLEMRNAVVHRGRQLSTWVPHSSHGKHGALLHVVTQTPIHELTRYEQHLRRQPWQPDLVALIEATGAEANWLAEPATATMGGILASMTNLVETTVAVLLEVWDRTAGGAAQLDSPVDEWAPVHRSPEARVRRAEQFMGFDPGHLNSPTTALRMSPRDAQRAMVAEALRREVIS